MRSFYFSSPMTLSKKGVRTFTFEGSDVTTHTASFLSSFGTGRALGKSTKFLNSSSLSDCVLIYFFFFLESDTMPMYKVKPTTQSDIKIDLPTCMYKLPNVHAQHGSSCAECALQVKLLSESCSVCL